jgi:2-dehydro-3-deoxyphosphogluconate aldolase/(4S)-4-hydroxy-2-oxoglutarate aldolase
VDTLVENRLTIIEVTLNSLDALAAIAALQRRYADQACIGAGTVRSVEDAMRALDAGAAFLICPCFSPRLVEVARARDTLVIPGVMTPTEAQNAFEAGCRMQKLFPADPIGGPDYLKAIRAPLDDIDFVPTGGISQDNIAAYRRAGAAAVAIGSTLVSDRDRALPDIAQRAAACYRVWHGEG